MSDPSTSAAGPAPPLFAAGTRAILWAQVAKFFLRLVSASVLARLLTPDNYGLHGMAGVVYGLLYMVRDFGIVTAVQQPGDVAARLARLRRLGLFGGVALAGLGMLAGWPAAWFYHEPRLRAVLAGMAVGFALGGWSAPALGLLYREHRLAAIALSEVAALGLGVIVAVAAAFQGLGVWSLVLMGLVNELVMAAACWRLCRAPDLTASASPVRWREVLGFSASLTGHSVASYFARTGDQIVVGWAAGTAPLGLYGRGAQIAALPMQLGLAPFNGWAVASLARLRAEPAAYVDFFRRALNGLLHASLAAGAICFAAPDLVVHTFFGVRWMASVPVLHWLALGLAVQPLLFAQVWLLESTGQVGRLLRLSLLGMGLVVGACAAAVSQGIEAVALAGSIAVILQGVVGLALCRGCTPVTTRDMAAAGHWPAFSHVGWALLVLGARRLVPLTPGLNAWLLLAASAAVYYGGLLLASPRLRRELFGHFLLTR